MNPRRGVRSVGSLGLAACLGAEVVAGGLGFFGTIHLARRLEPQGFATLEVALAVAGWMLVLVRGGLDQIVVREAARHPRLIGRLTRLLIGLRLLWAVIGFAVVIVIAGLIGAGRSWVILASGLILFPSALVADAGPRARNELGLLAAMQLIRAAGLVSAAFFLVSRPTDLIYGAMGPAIAECLVALAFLGRAAGEPLALRGRPWELARLDPIHTAFLRRDQKRAASVFSKRAAVAGLTRFGRVGLYAADAMALGLVAGDRSGDYAAVRRVIFSLVAVGVVLPSLLGPGLSRAKGRDAISIEVGRGLNLLLGLFVPAALGLILIADRGIPLMFGSKYETGPLLVILIALRLPILLLATWFQSAIVALGREMTALRLTAVVGFLAVVTLPIAAIGFGMAGIALAIVAIESIAAVGGWWLLNRIGVEAGRSVELGPIVLGCLAMVGAVAITRPLPVVVTILSGVLAYGSAWAGARSFLKVVRPSTRPERLSLEGTLP